MHRLCCVVVLSEYVRYLSNCRASRLAGQEFCRLREDEGGEDWLVNTMQVVDLFRSCSVDAFLC